MHAVTEDAPAQGRVLRGGSARVLDWLERAGSWFPDPILMCLAAIGGRYRLL